MRRAGGHGAGAGAGGERGGERRDGDRDGDGGERGGLPLLQEGPRGAGVRGRAAALGPCGLERGEAAGRAGEEAVGAFVRLPRGFRAPGALVLGVGSGESG